MRNYRPDIFAYLDSRVGQTIWVAEIAEATKLTPRQITQCIKKAQTDNFWNSATRLEVISKGNAWIWHGKGTEPTGAAGYTLYEKIAQTRNGTVLVQDEAGNVYRLQELDI